jgi:hypothetical protein
MMSNQYYKLNEQDVTAKVIDGEAIIINLATSIYYSMDGVGSRIWELLTAGRGVESIIASLCDEYDVSEQKCRTDVCSLIEKLEGEKLIQPVPDGSSENPVGSAGKQSGEKYAAPYLNIYSDMAELLALDPPVPGMAPMPRDDSSASSGDSKN